MCPKPGFVPHRNLALSELNLTTHDHRAVKGTAACLVVGLRCWTLPPVVAVCTCSSITPLPFASFETTMVHRGAGARARFAARRDGRDGPGRGGGAGSRAMPSR